MLVALLAVTSLVGCAMRGISFVADHRVDVLRPEEKEKVSLPISVAWSAEDYDGYFVVFFDRSPMRPGQTLRSLVPDDDPCAPDRPCPDPQWLKDRNIYVTKGTRVKVEQLPDQRDSERAKDRHDLTIVLVDETGRRTGESAFTREFIVERP